MNEPLRRALAEALGAPVTQSRALAGGDINQAFAVTLGDGRRVFVKTNQHRQPDLFAAEARGLGFLAAAHAIRLPAVLACSDQPDAPFLALEFLDAGPRVADFDERLGRGLAALHRTTPGTLGLDRDNFIGRLPQDNRAAPGASWPSFYADKRLAPQIARAGGRLPADLRRTLDDVLDALARSPELAGPGEPVARLHGDLWGGNLHATQAGEPALIDPAAYGGAREVDLAMMRLFGGFSRRVFDAYEEAYPLAPGARERVPLYQLYPLLVHLNLFGGAYLGQVAAALDALGAVLPIGARR